MDLQDLREAPNRIARAAEVVAGRRAEIRDLEASIRERQLMIVGSRHSKDWGANEGDRKNAQATAFGADHILGRLQRDLKSAEIDLAMDEIEEARQKNLFYALRTLAEYEAALALSGRTITGAGIGEYIATAADIGM